MPCTKKSIFAHRGYHASASRENTICAFKTAIHAVDGFECDVRLSVDGIPVIVHDATLRRTHGLAVRVNSLTASELQLLDIPSAFAVLALPNLHDKTIILDLKERERMLCARLGPAIDACAARVILLSYANNRPTTRHVVYRAVNYNFTVYSAFDGIACKFNGSVVNMSSISRALRAGIKVNLFAQLHSDEAKMFSLYDVQCTHTVATTRSIPTPCIKGIFDYAELMHKKRSKRKTKRVSSGFSFWISGRRNRVFERCHSWGQ